MIQVSSDYLSAAFYLSSLKADKNKFTKPNFKKHLKSNPAESLATVLRGEEFERGKGREIRERIEKVKQEGKGWGLIMKVVSGEASHKELDQGSTAGTEVKRKGVGTQYAKEVREKAKEADSLRQKRTKSAIIIQKHVKAHLARVKVAQMRLERQAGLKIKHFLGSLVRRRKLIQKGLRFFRQHFYASVITRFMRQSCEILTVERQNRRREDIIRGLSSGIKARMIFNLPRMKETKQLILNLIDQLNDVDLDLKERRKLLDDVKYQKNLYSNLFHKFWSKKNSVTEELQRNKERERKIRPSIQLKEALTDREGRLSTKRSPSITEIVKGSRLSSRKPSLDHTIDDLKASPQLPMNPNPDDRPIKPMDNSALNFGGDPETRGMTPKHSVKHKPDTKKPKETKELSDKVLKQKELMEKRRKYDPRKAAQNNTKPETDEEDKKVSIHRKSLDHIAENMSEDKSVFLGHEDMAGGIDADGKPIVKKEYLKRKTKKVEFKKLDWSNVQRRIDCWVPKDNIPEKKLPRKISPRPNIKPNTSSNPRDLNMIKLKNEENSNKKKEQAKKEKVEKKDKDLMVQIEETLVKSYLPKLEEVFSKEIVIQEGSKIPTLKNDSRFILYIEENDLKDVLEELEEEYDFLVNI